MYMYIAYVCFVFGSYKSSYTYVVDKMIRVCVCGGGGNQWKKDTVLRENGKYSYRSFF